MLSSPTRFDLQEKNPATRRANDFVDLLCLFFGCCASFSRNLRASTMCLSMCLSDFVSIQERDGAASSEWRLGSTSGHGGVCFELVARWAALFGRSGGGADFKGLDQAAGSGALVPRPDGGLRQRHILSCANALASCHI